MIKPIKVNALPDYKLHVSFDDGVEGIIDLRDFVKKGIFKPLIDQQLFSKAYTTGSAIAWPGGLEIDAFAVYAEILKKEPSDIRSSNLQHASD